MINEPPVFSAGQRPDTRRPVLSLSPELARTGGAIVSNVSNVRKSARKLQLGAEDAAGVAWAVQLAGMLDRCHPRTLRQIANGERDLSLEDRLELVRIVGPQYLRTLTALGMTRAGRGVAAAATTGSPAGVSAEQAAHDAHRQRFSERARGA